MTVEIVSLHLTFGKNAQDRLAEAKNSGKDGALAAVETFYCAFNNRSPGLLKEIWLNDPLCQLNNPLGGIMRGIEPISALYEKIFNGPSRVWVEFYDIVLYFTGDAAIFAGRERGEFLKGETTVNLAIRTTRVFIYDSAAGRWAQAHHHGSIDDAALLNRYQKAVNP